VGADPESDQLYHLTYDGSIVDEPDYVAHSLAPSA
jgi:hypothetical protein